MMDRANEFAEIYSSLSSLKADGWTGRAANRFREKYKLQLQGWLDAQEAFSSASTAYSTYASTLQSAQSQCDEIRSRWEQGRQAVEQAQNNKADARSRAQAEGGIPMIDASCDEGPGRATMQGAEEDFQALVNEVNEAGNQLNSVLDEGISKLPERTWLDAVSRTAGSFGLGVKDAVTDLFNLLFLGTPTLLNDFRRLITGGLTPEEFFLSYGEVPAEKLGAFCTALANNPKKFFKEVFFGLIDAETWSDDPGRALGRLAPDVALTIATAGAAASAKGLKGAARAAYIGREVVLSVTHISDVSDLVRASRRLAGKLARIGSDAASGLANLGSHLPHSGTTPHTHVPTAPTNPTGHGGTPTMPSAGTPSYPSHGAPTMPSAGTPSYPSHGAPSYGTGGTPSASASPSYGSGSTPNTSGMPAPSHGNGAHSGNPSFGGTGAADPTSTHTPPTHQQNGTSGTTQPGTTPQASSTGTSGAATPAAGAHGNPSGPAHNGMAGEGVSAADGLPPRRSIDPDEPRNGSSNDFHSSADRGESYDAGNRKDSNHLNVDSRDFDKSSNGQYSPANNTGTPQQGTGSTDELVGAGVGRSEASLGSQGSYERAGAFGGSDPSRVSHGADGFGGTADFGANAGRGTHGANGATNSADTSGGLSSTPSSSHSTGSFTGHGGGHTGADSGTHGGSSTPAQGSYPAAGNPHVPSHADSGSGAGLPQHASDPTVGADAPHTTHAGADGATDTSHAGHGDGASHTADGTPHTTEPSDDVKKNPYYDVLSGNEPSHAHHATPDAPDSTPHTTEPSDDVKKNPYYDVLSGNEPSHAHHSTPNAPHATHAGADGATDMSHAGHGDGASPTADGKPHAADPTTPTHEADGATEASNGSNSDDALADPHNKSTHKGDNTPNGDNSSTTADEDDADTFDAELFEAYGHKYYDKHARISSKDWLLNIEQAPPFYEVEARRAWAKNIEMKYGLDSEGLLLTNDYTAPEYQRINGDIRDPSVELSPEQLHQLEVRDEFLKTLPEFRGTLYRGFTMNEGKLLEILESGTFSDPAYLSTSKSDDVAESFMRKNDLAEGEVRAMYEIRNGSGPDVGPISYAQHEGEVLIGRNSEYDITSYERRYNPQEDKWEYYAILEPKR